MDGVNNSVPSKTSFIKDCSSLISKHKYNENDNWNEEKSIFLNWNASPQWGADMNIVKLIRNTILPILNHMKTSNNQLLYQEMITDFYYESSDIDSNKTLDLYIPMNLSVLIMAWEVS